MSARTNVRRIAEALAVTCELTDTDMTDAAKRVMVQDLAKFDAGLVEGALTRCRRELTGRLTLQAILTRLDDGRPGPEEAWATVQVGEGDTLVWTDEMAEAWGTASGLLAAGERVAARMAFKERYEQLVVDARLRGSPPRWTVSLGHDPAGREGALMQAVQAGRLPAEHAAKLLPAGEPRDRLLKLAHEAAAMLESPA